MLDLDAILEQVTAGDPVGAAYRLGQEAGADAAGRMFYEAGSVALARREELGDGALRFARIVFAEAVERDPSLWEAHHDLATTMRELGMSEDAIAHFTSALAFSPSDVDSMIGLGAAQCDAGRIDEGIVSLQRAVELHPENGRAFANLGLAYEAS
ncbi:MAG: tetratricopeptide repeat protein, partial [Myxococcales bacterium]|nr:tetratricopeptide repeat protein [Myxococcales bacterium]